MSSAPTSIAPDQSSQATGDIVTAPSVGTAATGSLLVRTILEAYGKEILESASEQFLDLALEVRLQTISPRELAKLLAKANRLGYQENDTVDDENGASPVQGGNENLRSKPDAVGTPKPRGAIAGERGPHCATPSQPLFLKNARAPNHTKTSQVLQDEHISANTHLPAQKAAPSAKEGGDSHQSIQGVASIHDEVPAPAGPAKKRGQTTTGSGSRVVACVAKSRNASKRGLAQDTRGGVQKRRPRKLFRASTGKSSLSISAQPLQLVVISDTEPELEDDSDH